MKRFIVGLFILLGSCIAANAQCNGIFPGSTICGNLSGIPAPPIATTLGSGLPVTLGGTGTTSFTANLPLIGNGTGALAQGTRSGNTTAFATVSGALGTGNCVSIDSSGNLVDAGASCSASSGSVNAGTTNQAAYYAGNGSTVSGTSLGNIPYLVTNGTTARKDQDRWVDNATEAPDIGVDCTGVGDSTSAIQTWVTAHLGGGHLKFPVGCQVMITSTIAVTDGVNMKFSSELSPGQGGPGATLIWKGGNGGNACSASFASCVYMFDLEHTDHPRFENLAFLGDEVSSGWVGDVNCPDGFLKFDGNPGVHIGTSGHVIQNSFNNNCINPNFVAINIAQTATGNHENYFIYDNVISCSVKSAGHLSYDGVSNGTTTLTSASGPFATNNVGQRIRISHQGGEFDTSIAAFVSSTQVTLAAAVPWSDTAQTLHLGQGYGVGIRNGASQNALQQVVYKITASFCEVGLLQQGGNMSMTQPSGAANDFGIFIGGFSAEQTDVNFSAFEDNLVEVYIGGGAAPVSLRNERGSNGLQLATGFIPLAGQVRMTDSTIAFGPHSSNENYLTPVYTYKVNSTGTVVAGSGYTDGTYTNVPMLFTTSISPAAPTSGVGGDRGVKATVVVSGGVVTTVTITTAGSFISFPLPVTSGFNGGTNIVTWSLTAASSDIGGTGTGFSVPVTSIRTNTISGNVDLTSINNIWTVGAWTYSQIGLANFGTTGSHIFTINDAWDDVTNIASNITICSSNHTTIQGPSTCNVITNNVNAGIGVDMVTNSFTAGAGPAVGYRNEGAFTGASNTSFTGFQAIPSSGRISLYQAGFENAATDVDMSNGMTANYGFIARQMTSYFGATLASAYGFYTEGQKITNVTAGWGFYSAGATDGNFMAGNLMLGNNTLTVPAGGLGLAKITADGSGAGAAGGKIELVCGTNSGSAKLIAYAGTSSTPVTILDNIGSGVTGC